MSYSKGNKSIVSEYDNHKIVPKPDTPENRKKAAEAYEHAIQLAKELKKNIIKINKKHPRVLFKCKGGGGRWQKMIILNDPPEMVYRSTQQRSRRFIRNK